MKESAYPVITSIDQSNDLIPVSQKTANGYVKKNIAPVNLFGTKYKKVVFLISEVGQTIVAHTLENDFEVTPVFTYNSAGIYDLTMTGCFGSDAHKVVFLQSQCGNLNVDPYGNVTGSTIRFDYGNPDLVEFVSFINGQNPQDDLISNISVEIRVYP